MTNRPPRSPFDRSDGYFGQDYSVEREEADGEKQLSGHPLTGCPEIPEATTDGADLPPEAGRRAHFDSTTGEVRGSASGAGGGNPGEDYDVGTAGAAPEAPRAGERPDR